MVRQSADEDAPAETGERIESAQLRRISVARQRLARVSRDTRTALTRSRHHVRQIVAIQISDRHIYPIAVVRTAREEVRHRIENAAAKERCGARCYR